MILHHKISSIAVNLNDNNILSKPYDNNVDNDDDNNDIIYIIIIDVSCSGSRGKTNKFTLAVGLSLSVEFICFYETQ